MREPTSFEVGSAFVSVSVAAAADDEERDENDPDPVVVEKRAKATYVASTVRVHIRSFLPLMAAQKMLINFAIEAKFAREAVDLSVNEYVLHAVLL